MDFRSPEYMSKLLSQMGKTQPVRTVAKNIAKSLADQFKLDEVNSIMSALEEAFVRGSNWQRMKDKKEENEKITDD